MRLVLPISFARNRSAPGNCWTRRFRAPQKSIRKSTPSWSSTTTMRSSRSARVAGRPSPVPFLLKDLDLQNCHDSGATSSGQLITTAISPSVSSKPASRFWQGSELAGATTESLVRSDPQSRNLSTPRADHPAVRRPPRAHPADGACQRRRQFGGFPTLPPACWHEPHGRAIRWSIAAKAGVLSCGCRRIACATAVMMDAIHGLSRRASMSRRRAAVCAGGRPRSRQAPHQLHRQIALWRCHRSRNRGGGS